MVLTGENTTPSECISFDSTKGYALPLARPDADGCVDAIRVSMAGAVQFMADLLRKEEAFLSELKPNAIDPNLDPGLHPTQRSGWMESSKRRIKEASTRYVQHGKPYRELEQRTEEKSAHH